MQCRQVTALHCGLKLLEFCGQCGTHRVSLLQTSLTTEGSLALSLRACTNWRPSPSSRPLPLCQADPGSAVFAVPDQLPAHPCCLNYEVQHGTLLAPCSRTVLKHPGCEAAQLTDLRHGAELLELEGGHGGCLALPLRELVQLLSQVRALLLGYLHRR